MPSTMPTAPVFTFSQSSSDTGLCSSIPLDVLSHQTASKTLSESGSIMFSINSLTDTTGVMSPMSADLAGAGFGSGAGFEQVTVTTAAKRQAAATTGLRKTSVIT